MLFRSARGKRGATPAPNQLSLFADEQETILRELRGTDLLNLTPLEALRRLAGWKERLDRP